MSSIYLTYFSTDGRRGTYHYMHLYDRMTRQCQRWGMIPCGWTADMLERSEYWRANHDILTIQRGAGLCTWKAYFMLEAMSQAKPGDVVAYCDVTVLFKDDPRPYFERAREDGALLISTPFVNEEWTTDLCFEVMDCDTPLYRKAPQLWAGCLAVPKTVQGQRFLVDWLLWCGNKLALDRVPSVRDNFRDHRDDQSILTNLALRYGLPCAPCLNFEDNINAEADLELCYETV